MNDNHKGLAAMSITIGLCALLISSIGVGAWLSSLNEQPTAIFASKNDQYQQKKGEPLEEKIEDVKQLLSIQMMQMNEQRQHQKEKNKQLEQQIKQIQEQVIALNKVQSDQRDDADRTMLKADPKKETPQSNPAIKAASSRPTKKPGNSNQQGWMVNLTSSKTAAPAEVLVQRLKLLDIPAEYLRVVVKGGAWFRVRVSGFANKQEATAYQKFLKKVHGLDAWLGRD